MIVMAVQGTMMPDVCDVWQRGWEMWCRWLRDTCVCLCASQHAAITAIAAQLCTICRLCTNLRLKLPPGCEHGLQH